MEASLTNILELALQQGIWAALYIYLFFRMLSENKEREDKYQTIIDRLSGNIEQGIEDIQERLEQLAAKNKLTLNEMVLLSSYTPIAPWHCATPESLICRPASTLHV